MPQLCLALIADVFYQEDGPERLIAHLEQAKAAGAELALLPELPLNPWSAATQHQLDEDAEAPLGPRHQIQAEAAAQVGIGLIGGAIVRDPQTNQRYNTALVFDATGKLLATYQKTHIPEEEGFWESSHYQPGTAAPQRIDGFALPLGVQICSDNNRPQGCQLLGAQGAQLVVCPRATEAATYPIWRPIFVANALTTSTFVASVNRPAPEQGVPIGGPSIVVDPRGRMILESNQTVSTILLDSEVCQEARQAYPGYLDIRCDLYASAWADLANKNDVIKSRWSVPSPPASSAT